MSSLNITGNGTQFSSAFTDLRVWHLRKGLLQHPIAPPRRCMVAKDLLPGGLPLGMAKPPTQQKVAFHLIRFLGAIPGGPIVSSGQDR